MRLTTFVTACALALALAASAAAHRPRACTLELGLERLETCQERNVAHYAGAVRFLERVGVRANARLAYELRWHRLMRDAIAPELEETRARIVRARFRQTFEPGRVPVRWRALFGCEGGGYGYLANTGNGFYFGPQFTYSTWRANGGPPFDTRSWSTPERGRIVGSPPRFSLELIIRVSESTLRSQGRGAWPNCGHLIGG
jgi:hypothetical protein